MGAIALRIVAIASCIFKHAFLERGSWLENLGLDGSDRPSSDAAQPLLNVFSTLQMSKISHILG